MIQEKLHPCCDSLAHFFSHAIFVLHDILSHAYMQSDMQWNSLLECPSFQLAGSASWSTRKITSSKGVNITNNAQFLLHNGKKCTKVTLSVCFKYLHVGECRGQAFIVAIFVKCLFSLVTLSEHIFSQLLQPFFFAFQPYPTSPNMQNVLPSYTEYTIILYM